MRAVVKALVTVLRGYQLLLSPWLGSQCRFTPSCSAYAIGALQAHGAGSGSYLAARRVLRCHPGCAGGWDPVPALRQATKRSNHVPDSSDDRPRAGLTP